MRVIVSGSRDFDDENFVFAILDEIHQGKGIDEIIHGGCRGADKIGEAWADLRGVYVKEFAADWNKYGKKAGPIRNRSMALRADLLVAFYEGKCGKGTRDMVNAALEVGLDIMVARKPTGSLIQAGPVDGLKPPETE
jgi:hypothetical protein